MTRIAGVGIGLLLMGWTGVDGQRRVELPARDTPLRSRPAAVWSVGAAEGESWELLSNVTAMAFDRSDRLFALDQGNHRVLVFDATGRFIRQFGKQGGGPGEFQLPMGLVVLSDGRVAVLDPAKRAFSLFTAEGTYQRDVFLPEELGFPRPGETYALPDGSVMTRTMAFIRFGAGGGPPDLNAPQKSPLFRMTMGEKPATTTLHEFTMAPPTVRAAQVAGGRQTQVAVYGPPVFEKQPTFAALPDGGVAISVTPDYTIDIKSADGGPLRSLTRPLAPRRVTTRDMEVAREERRRQLENISRGGGAVFVTRGGGGGAQRGAVPQLSEAQIQEQLQNLTFADQVPVIERIWSDPVGRLWVQRSPREAGGDRAIDLIAQADRYIGTITGVALPSAVSTSGLAAWIERDAMDVEKIVVRRLPADWR